MLTEEFQPSDLEIYEEGSFMPVTYSAKDGVTYDTSRQGHYERIGNVIRFRLSTDEEISC